MKNKPLIITLIVVLSIIAIAITWLMINLLTGKFSLNSFRFFSSTSKELAVDETYNIDFNNINISVESGDIYVRETADNNFKVIIYNEKEKTVVNTLNNKLNIEVKSKKCIGFCFNVDSKVEVYVPKDYQYDMKITNKFGDIEVGSFEKATIDIEEDCGDVSVLTANVVNINNEYVDIEIGKVNVANVSDSAGDIEIEEVHDAKVNNNFGDIEINTVLNYLDVNNDCGDIEIDNVTLNKDSKITDDLGEIKIGKTNEININAETDLGDVKIKNNYPKSEVTLTIENNCGSIKVDN